MAAVPTTSTTAAAARTTTTSSSVAARKTSVTSAAAASSSTSASAAASSSSASAAASSSAASSSARASSSSSVASSSPAAASSSAARSTATLNSSSIQAFISQSASSGGSSGNGNGLKPSTIGAIVGGVVGGLVLIVVAFKLWRRRRRWIRGGDSTPLPPPQPMAYRGGMHSRGPSDMKRVSSYNALALPGLSHQSSMGMLSSTPGSPYGAPAYGPDTPSTPFEQDPERLYLESPELPAPQPVYRGPLNDAEGAMLAPSLLPAGGDDEAYHTSPPSTRSSPAPADYPPTTGSPLGGGPAPSIRTMSNSAESSLDQRALASRSASNSSTTSSPPLLPDGSRRPHRSPSTQQLQRMSHQRNLTISTAGWAAPGAGGFSPSHRSASRYSMSGLPRDVSVRDLSGTPHNGRPIALTMPTPLSQSTSQEGYLRPSASMSMYGAPAGYGGAGMGEFGAYAGGGPGSGPASSVGSAHGRAHASRPPSSLGPA